MNRPARRLFVALLSIVFTGLLANPAVSLPLTDSQGERLPTLAPMLKRVNPAVVNIATFSRQQAYNPLLNDPFFRHFFNLPDPRQQQPSKRQTSAGSGVIVDAKNGTVLTNYHVIHEADEVQVALIDGRSFAAKVLGVDPELDIAVLKIEAGDLSAVPMANSSELEVGDFAVAIGNPFGLGQTVTTGVISALGRSGLGMEGYENFIQTDASINPGNSGGALVNLRGELIGINTAIIAPAGGNVGIGFAIPVNMARASMEQILKNGKVRRGQIGVSIQDITPDLRKAFNLPLGLQGVLVTGVTEKSPADKAGLKAGDIILSIENEPTNSVAQLRSQIGAIPVGSKFKLSMLRDTQRKTLTLQVEDPDKLMGMSSNLHPLLKGARFANSEEPAGVVVASLAPNSPAIHSGLRVGDIILAANQQRVRNLDQFSKALRSEQAQILLNIQRQNNAFYLIIR